MDPEDFNHTDPEGRREPQDSRVRVLKELVQSARYVVDEQAVAEAILHRAPKPGNGRAPDQA